VDSYGHIPGVYCYAGKTYQSEKELPKELFELVVAPAAAKDAGNKGSDKK
jgi:hypothetical protein